MNSSAQSSRKAACPVCDSPVTEKYAPFCSKRCADVDLHQWLNGGYAIPGPFDPEAAEEAANAAERGATLHKFD